MSHADSIQQLLSHKPGLKAQQIADELGLERSQVVTSLHGLLGERSHPGQRLPLVAEDTRDAQAGTAPRRPRPEPFWPTSAATTWNACRAKAVPASAFRPRIPPAMWLWANFPSPAGRTSPGPPIARSRRSCRRCAASAASSRSTSAMPFACVRSVARNEEEMRHRAGAALSHRGDGGGSPSRCGRRAASRSSISRS